MKCKVIIVDDEPMSLNLLERYCIKNGNLQVNGKFENALAALDYLLHNETDLLFLDIEMPNLSGFQLLDQLLYMPRVILTTAKTDHAFNAFQYGVADYLKKPIAFNRFQEAVTKITASFTPNDTQAGVKNAETKQEEIFIKADGKLTRLKFQEILYIESLGDYVKYFTNSKNYISLSTLKAVEEKIAGNNFMKVHRSYIVNLQKIKDIQDNSLVIEGKVIPISKSFKSEILNRINVV